MQQDRTTFAQKVQESGLGGTVAKMFFVPVLTQGVVLMQFLFALQILSASVSDLSTGGVLWFTNLAESDPYRRLPVITALGLIGSFEVILFVE